MLRATALLLLLSLGGCLPALPAFDTDPDTTVDTDSDTLDPTDDTDGDGVVDVLDHCPEGLSDWTSQPNTDHDGDGCQDILEDADDDNDNALDAFDSCPVGATGWTSTGATDYDSDGCRDAGEDDDDDNDGVVDAEDACRAGNLGWVSTGATDHDGDGCRDATEDTDDDDDGVPDSVDGCPTGAVGWTSDSTHDRDADGCYDPTEDLDDDGDGVVDHEDACPVGNIGWTSGVSTDHDGDGCRDAGEDQDDDNDGRPDISDECARGETGWTATSVTDRDSDGCRDATEDEDDDGDSVVDRDDACPAGAMGWTSGPITDHDGDGCLDVGEDPDDDGDGVADGPDGCQRGETGWVSNAATDRDSDGCRDATEDADDDEDGVADGVDRCAAGELGWTSNSTTDHDGDGCRDATEDPDDDNDGVVDSIDACRRGETGWQSTVSEDFDRDGCRDATEDPDDDNDTHADVDDCGPLDPSRYPGAPEECDGIDSDCAGDAFDGDLAAHVFMSPDADNNAADGSPAHPYATLAAALAAAQADGRTIIAATGRYLGPASHGAGAQEITVRGGFEACDFGFAGESERPLFTSAATAQHTIEVTNGRRLVLEGVEIEASERCTTCAAVSVNGAEVALYHAEVLAMGQTATRNYGLRAVGVSEVSIVGGLILADSAGVATGVSMSAGFAMVKEALVAASGPTSIGVEVLGGDVTVLRSKVIVDTTREPSVAVGCGGAGTGASAARSVEVFESVLWGGTGLTVSALAVGATCEADVVGSMLILEEGAGPVARLGGTSAQEAVSFVNTAMGGPSGSSLLGFDATSLPPRRTRMAGVVVDSDAFGVSVNGVPVVTTWSGFEQCQWNSCELHEPVVSAPDLGLTWGGIEPDSPCVDFGVDPAPLGYADRTLDLELLPRPVDGDGDGAAQFDAGPFELQP